MKRWHDERDLMLRRWRLEIAVHEGAWVWQGWLAPLPPDPEGDCHCYRGPGYFRKRTPFGCSSGTCLCKYEKNRPKARHNHRRAAIEFELLASA